MFFEIELLRRGGKFHLIWKSATLGINKLKRKEVLSIDVVHTCQYILTFVISDSRRPRDRFSLTLSSKLINGIARILDKQAELLLKDIWTFLAIVRKPILLAEIEDVSDQFDVPRPTRKARTKRKIPVVEPQAQVPQVEAEPEVQPVTDILSITLREPTERQQKNINEEFLDLGTGEEPELLGTQLPTSKVDVTTEMVVDPAKQKRSSRDIGIVSVSKVPKKSATTSIEEAIKETTLQMSEAAQQVSEIIPPEISDVQPPKEPEPATKVPEAAKESFIKATPKKKLPRNKLLITIKAKKALYIIENDDDLYTDSTVHIKSVPEESLENLVRNSKVDFHVLFAKFSRAVEDIPIQLAGEFSKDNVSQISSLKLASGSTTLRESATGPSLQHISDVPQITTPVVEKQTVFADVHESLIGNISNGQDVSQSMLEEKDLDTRERLRYIVRKIINFEEKNNAHATLVDISRRPLTKLIVAKLFNDLLSLVKLQYVRLLSKPNSLELDHIELGPKTLQ